jgi:hypothetical protein
MTFAEAFAKIQQSLPAGVYFSLVVDAARHHNGSIQVKWRAYRNDRTPGWTGEHCTIEGVIDELRGDPPPQTVDGIDPIPEATP